MTQNNFSGQLSEQAEQQLVASASARHHPILNLTIGSQMGGLLGATLTLVEAAIDVGFANGIRGP